MSKTIVIKYGGNAMTDKSLQKGVIKQISQLRQAGHKVVLVHGGGPFIAQFLDMASIESNFVEGNRVTDDGAIHYVEAALKGYVNGMLTAMCHAENLNAIGLSGKDGPMVLCSKKVINGQSLGWVGEVEKADTQLLQNLLQSGYLPVVTCIATDEQGNTYNVNGDLFAAALAADLKADHFLVLTNTNGLYEDIDRPESLIREASEEELKTRYKEAIAGGMLPKVEACLYSLRHGTDDVRIINGTEPQNIADTILHEKTIGTKIKKQ